MTCFQAHPVHYSFFKKILFKSYYLFSGSPGTLLFLYENIIYKLWRVFRLTQYTTLPLRKYHLQTMTYFQGHPVHYSSFTKISFTNCDVFSGSPSTLLFLYKNIIYKLWCVFRVTQYTTLPLRKYYLKTVTCVQAHPVHYSPFTKISFTNCDVFSGSPDTLFFLYANFIYKL